MNSYAHSHPDHPDDPSVWEPLFTSFGSAPTDCQGDQCVKCPQLEPYHGHINKTAFLAAEFAGTMFAPGSPAAQTARSWGRLAGLWHDLGKFAPHWQTYLRSKVDPHADELSGKVDHSTAGAILTHGMPPFGDILSYVIAGHHAGLADGVRLFPKGERLHKCVAEWRDQAEAAGIPLQEPIPCPPLTRPEAGTDAMAFMLRFFFSCLTDADWLATESFMEPEKTLQRTSWPEDIIDRMLAALEAYMARKFVGAASNPVNHARESVRRDCEAAADHPSGRFFALTVPTGGGKTLSSLLFALRHARRNGLRRVILVIPFTSIIKQNADVFREVFAELSQELGREIVLEHHSKFDPAKETEHNRLAAENWDAPLIVTTNVRFFESLFANRPRDCRKLHRTARSVLIFDEVQALPNSLLAPILRALTCLVKDLGASAVLCTATQPALEKRGKFEIGLPPEDITPIIQDEAGLFATLDRVDCHHLGAMDDEALVRHILQYPAEGCLLILNTTKAARTLHGKLSAQEVDPPLTVRHLSARMCPAHVVEVLEEATSLRKAGSPVVVVATQIVEAGVDISFPVVYRAECGLDSFAQAAGRCNRHGELAPAKGRVYLLQPTDHPIPKALGDLTAAAGITRAQILGNYAESALLSLAAIRSYFEHAIWQAGDRTAKWDKPGIVSGGMPCFNPRDQSMGWAQAWSFKTAAEKFRMIDSDTHPILIPWNDEAKALADEIRRRDRLHIPLAREHYRLAQQFSVQVYDHEWKQMQDRVSLHSEGAVAILIHPENDYSRETGLKPLETSDDPRAFCL